MTKLAAALTAILVLVTLPLSAEGQLPSAPTLIDLTIRDAPYFYVNGLLTLTAPGVYDFSFDFTYNVQDLLPPSFVDPVRGLATYSLAMTPVGNPLHSYLEWDIAAYFEPASPGGNRRHGVYFGHETSGGFRAYAAPSGDPWEFYSGTVILREYADGYKEIAGGMSAYNLIHGDIPTSIGQTTAWNIETSPEPSSWLLLSLGLLTAPLVRSRRRSRSHDTLRSA